MKEGRNEGKDGKKGQKGTEGMNILPVRLSKAGAIA
jgi:hypothetical protein